MTCTFDEQEMRNLLAEIAALLDNVGEEFWSTKVRSAVASLNVEEILSWYGVMGSLNDVIIAPENGHRLKREEQSAKNSKLDVLRRRMFDLARRFVFLATVN